VSPAELRNLEDMDTDNINIEDGERIVEKLPDLNDIFEEIGDSIAETPPDLEHPDKR